MRDLEGPTSFRPFENTLQCGCYKYLCNLSGDHSLPSRRCTDVILALVTIKYAKCWCVFRDTHYYCWMDGRLLRFATHVLGLDCCPVTTPTLHQHGPEPGQCLLTVCLVSTKYLHIEGCLLLIMLCWLSSSSYSVVLAQCCVVWRRGLDQLSQLINLLVSTFPLFLLFSLFTCYSHYVIIIVLVIIFGQGSITLVLPGRKK